MILSGRVTHAATGRPLAGVSVSDGRHFAMTDADGAYSLPLWEGAHLVFVNLLTLGHGDWFFYLEPGREEYHFSLTPVESADDFCFLHVSDTEIDGRDYMDCVSFMRRLVKEHRPAFFSHTGDLGRTSVARHYLVMNNETLGCPVRYSIGNHDFVGEHYGEETYERLYGPTWYSFNCGAIHFVSLSIGRGDRPSGYRPTDQWEWLAEDLRRNRGERRVIVLDHDRCSHDETGFTVPVGEDRLSLRNEGLLAWVFGHFHVHMLHELDGVFNICTACPDCGGIDSSPAAVRKIALQGTQLSSKMLFDGWNVESDPSLWTAQLEGRVEFATPILVQGDLLVATSDDGYPKRCGVYRLRGTDGAVVWHYPTPNGIKGNLATDGERVWVQDTAGTLYCLHAADGRLLWRAQSKLLKLAYTRSGVLLAGDLVIAGNVKQISAYDAAGGTLRWHTELPYGENTPAAFVWDRKRDRILVSAHWRALFSLDRASGAVCWESREHALFFRTETPLVLGDRIYLCGLDSAMILDAASGETLRHENVGMRMDVSGEPVYADGLLYCPTATDGVVALDAETLSVKRLYAVEPAVAFSSPYISGCVQSVEGRVVLDGERMLFTALDGGLYRYNRVGAKNVHRRSIGAPSLVSPLVTADAVYTADYSGRVRKFARE